MFDLNKIRMVREEDCNEKLDWRADLYHECVYYFFYEDKIVAEAILFIYSNEIKIDNIEARYKGRGYGEAILNFLKEYAKNAGITSLTGESVSEAINFWLKCGAEFRDEDAIECPDCEDCNSCPHSSECLDALHPFSIKI